jgi:energy-coupling factor transporter ATP-binding protein EcfA2
MSEIIASFDEVSYFYPKSEKPVLNHITFEIKKGEFLGLIGPTGAGKTTLCFALNGIVPQFFGGRFFGEIRVAGLDTVEHPISLLSRNVCEVFEDPETQLVTTSVENEIAFALENQKVPKDEIVARIPRVLEAVRLEGTEKRHPHELSGGQKQRLAIAAALAVQPALLVLDEPTSQLDPVGAAEVFSTVRELNKELGVTILMASHAAEEMAEFADRIALISQGKIITDGTPGEIYAQVEMLEENYLRPPQVARTFYLIGNRHIPVPSIPVCLPEGIIALDEICKINKPHPVGELYKKEETNNREIFVSIKDLTHTYANGVQALHSVSLDISRGEYVLIIGQNGAGKSTLVKHFLKLLVPTTGSVKIGGTETGELEMANLAQRIGYIAQNPDNQIFTSTVGDEVSFALKNLEFPKEEVEQRTVESLESMGLLDVRNAHPLSLPKGDRARVVIAAILAMQPDTIIFDEPTTGQDYRGARYILDISKKLHQLGKTVIVITHHLYLMADYAQRVIVMGKGTVLMDAPIRKTFHEVDLLKSTFLTPPQAVLLARELGRSNGKTDFPLLTPEEVAQVFVADPERINHV